MAFVVAVVAVVVVVRDSVVCDFFGVGVVDVVVVLVDGVTWPAGHVNDESPRVGKLPGKHVNQKRMVIPRRSCETEESGGMLLVKVRCDLMFGSYAGQDTGTLRGLLGSLSKGIYFIRYIYTRPSGWLM